QDQGVDRLQEAGVVAATKAAEVFVGAEKVGLHLLGRASLVEKIGPGGIAGIIHEACEDSAIEIAHNQRMILLAAFHLLDDLRSGLTLVEQTRPESKATRVGQAVEQIGIDLGDEKLVWRKVRAACREVASYG